MLNSQFPQTAWAMDGAEGVWVGVMLEPSGCDKVDGPMLGNSMVSAILWDDYKPLDVAIGSGHDCVVSELGSQPRMNGIPVS